MSDTFKKIVMVSRPISWPNTAYPFAAAYLIAGGDNYPLLMIAVFFFLIPYNLLMYGINDIFDYESDIRNPRKGGIEGMREQKELHPVIAKSIIVTTVPFVVYLLINGSIASNSILLAVLFFVIAYSAAKLRFKEIPLLDSITSSIHFVGPAVYALTLTEFSPDAWPYVLAFFLWGMASHAFGAVQDIIPDRQANIASIATFLGARGTVCFAALLYVLAAGILVIQPFPFNVIAIVGLLYVVNICGLYGITDRTSGDANKPWRRFIWMNLFSGFIITIILLANVLS